MTFRLMESANSTVAHVVRPRYVCKHFSGLPPGNRFFSLMDCQFWFTTQNDSPGLRPLAPLAGSGPDELALKLGETAQNGQHQATMRRRRISLGISERFETGPLLGDRPQQIEKIACGPRQSIETGNDQNISLCQARYRARKLLAVGSSSAEISWRILRL